MLCMLLFGVLCNCVCLYSFITTHLKLLSLSHLSVYRQNQPIGTAISTVVLDKRNATVIHMSTCYNNSNSHYSYE